MAKIIESELTGNTFEIDLDEDIKLECTALLMFERDGRMFLAAHPMDEFFDEDEVMIFEIMSDGEELEIADIDDEDEYDEIFEDFEELFYEYTESVDDYEIVEEEFGAE